MKKRNRFLVVAAAAAALRSRWIVLVLAYTMAWPGYAATVIDFEDITTSGPGGLATSVCTQYSSPQGCTFNCPVAFDYSTAIPGFAHSGAKAIEQCYISDLGCGTPIEMNFVGTQLRVKVWVGYSARLRQPQTVILRAFDGANTLLRQASVNWAASMDPIPIQTPLEVSALGIKRATVAFVGSEAPDGPANRNLAVDDVEFDPQTGPPDFGLTASVGLLRLVPGSSRSFQVIITRLNGSSGSIQFSISGLPAGVSASFPSSANTSPTVTLTAAPNAPITGDAGQTVTVTGTPSSIPSVGPAPRQTTLAVSVRNNFTVSLNPFVVDLPSCAMRTVVVNVSRDFAFSGPVSLSAVGLPPGVSATFDPPTIDWHDGGVGNYSTLTLSSSDRLSARSVIAQIGGSSPSSPSASAFLTLNLTGDNTLCRTPIHVTDETGANVRGAEVYIAGVLSGTTDSAGLLYVNPQLPGGTQLAARKQVFESETYRGGHSAGSSENWKFRGYITSIRVNNDGSVTRATVGSDPFATQELRVLKNNALIGAHWVVSVEWDASQSELQVVSNKLGVASQFLYNATDGQFFIEQAELTDNGALWDDADAHVYANAGLRAHVNWPSHGFFDEAFSTRSWMHLARSNGGATYAHEFGHYGFDLGDEYSDDDRNVYCTRNQSVAGSPFQAGQPQAACMMWRQGSAPKLCSNRPENPHVHGTHQGDDACWDTFLDRFFDPVHRWSLQSPDTRGVIPGPINGGSLPVRGWAPRISINNHSRPNLCEPATYTFLSPLDGKPLPRVQVYGAGLLQGWTDANGNILVTGVHVGDSVAMLPQYVSNPGFGGSIIALAVNFVKSSADCVPAAALLAASQTAQQSPVVRMVPVQSSPFGLLVSAEPTFNAGEVRIQVQAARTSDGGVLPLTESPVVKFRLSGQSQAQQVNVQLDPATHAYHGLLAGLPAYVHGLVEITAADPSKQTLTSFAGLAMTGIDPNGETDVFSTDGQIHLTVPAGALVSGSRVAIGPSPLFPPILPEGFELVGGPFNVVASTGIQLSVPGTLRFVLPHLVDLPGSSGFDPDSFRILYYNPGTSAWENLGGVVLPSPTEIVTLHTSQLGVFALIGRPMPRDGESTPDDAAYNATPLPVANGLAMVTGRIAPAHDVDNYSFSAPAGAMVWATVDTGGPQGPRGNSLDSLLSLLGTNRIEVLEQDYDDGSGNGCDSTLESGEVSVIAAHTLTDGGMYYLRIEEQSGVGMIDPYKLLVAITTSRDTGDEVEPNNSAASANPILSATSVVGVRRANLGLPGDIDYYSAAANAGEILHICADGDPERDGIGTDLVVQLYSPVGALLFSANSSQSGSVISNDPPAEGFCYQIPSSGTYFVRVLHAAGQTGSYQLMVARHPCGTAGAFDPTFNSNGRRTFDWGGGANDTGRSIVLQPDGKLLILGRAGRNATSASEDFGLIRLDSGGGLDLNFDGGAPRTDFGFSDDEEAMAAALQPDGKIVVAGSDFRNFIDLISPAFAVARYNPDGTLDTTFNGTGKRLIGFDTPQTYVGSQARAVAVRPNGKIVVAGVVDGSALGTGEDFALAQLNADGTLDTSFGSAHTGKVQLDFSRGNDQVLALALQPDGRVVVAGSAFTYNLGVGNLNVGWARFSADGIFEDIASYDFNGGDDICTRVSIRPDGKMMLGGYARSPRGDCDFALLRLNTSGTLDTSFGNNGKTLTDFGGSSADTANALAVQSDGKIVLAGSSDCCNGGPSAFAVARFLPNGALDTSFGVYGNGLQVAAFTGSNPDSAYGLVLDGDGRIVTAGTAFIPGDDDFAVARFCPGEYPFLGLARAIPGRIEAEDYDNGGPEVGYADTTINVNEAAGGFRSDYRPGSGVDLETNSDGGNNVHVAYVHPREWLQYTVDVGSSGAYRVSALVSSSGVGGTFHIEFDGVDKTGPMMIPDTGGYLSFQTITKVCSTLSDGRHLMRVVFDSNGANGTFVGNLNYVDFASEPRPALTVQRSGNQVLISWPASAADFRLQSAPSLSAPVSWSAVPQTPVLAADRYSVTVPVEGAKTFYRLVCP